jgi:peptidoglycan/xylan/chitin deacetylase (PgdA/CDA1 family)
LSKSVLDWKEALTERAIVLMYHNIGIPPKGVTLKSLHVTPRMFRFQMWYLKSAGFKVVSLDEILSFINGKNFNEKLVAITFDDGYQDFYDNAFPVLKTYKFPSTVFLVSDLVGKKNLWDSQGRERLLHWDSILEMKDAGVVFGSHSKSHPFLSRLSEKELGDEIKGSKFLLEEKLKNSVDFFCYPNGDYDNRVLETVHTSGYKGAVTTNRGLIHRNDSPFEMTRSFIRYNTHPVLFLYKLHSKYEDRKGLRI